MSIDRIWKCTGGNWKDWIDLRTLPAEEFNKEHETVGPFVVTLSMGGNCAVDEAYHFAADAEARAFYAEDYLVITIREWIFCKYY